jgi:hypothetical protein
MTVAGRKTKKGWFSGSQMKKAFEERGPVQLGQINERGELTTGFSVKEVMLVTLTRMLSVKWLKPKPGDSGLEREQNKRGQKQQVYSHLFEEFFSKRDKERVQ